MNERLASVERKVDTKLIIMATWIALMCLYIYCDILSFYKPGQLSSILNGRMGPFGVSPMGIFWAAFLMVIPSMMIPVSTLAPARAGRIINLVISPVYFLVNIGNLLGETWGYYILFGSLEIGLVIFIFMISLRWPKQNG